MSSSSLTVKRSQMKYLKLQQESGPRRFPGGTTELMLLPPGMDSFELGEKLAVLENIKDRLKKVLAKLQGGHASVAVPVPPVLDMPHAAGASSVLHAPPHNESRPKTKGHEHWLPKQPEMLVKLWSAAKVQDIRGTGAITVLHTYWRTHSDRVLGALQQWFQHSQFLRSQSPEDGNAAAPTGDALGDALQSIRTSIPDWPTFGDDVDRQCFTKEIMSRDELVNLYDTAHRGGCVDLQPIYDKIAREKSTRAKRNRPVKVEAAEAPFAAAAPAAGSLAGWPAPFPALPVAGDSLQRCGQGPRLPALSGGLGGLGLLAPPLVSFFQITHQCCRQRD